MSDLSIAIADAFNQFSQATVSALGAYQQGTRARLVQADDDLRALRRERDDALRDLNASKDQARIWVAEVDKWKSESDRALIVNAHQAELVAQLRQEAQQWKDQCLRLEETLRGEIQAWKDQFLRVDAEHTRLLNQLSSQVTLARTPKRALIPTGDSSATSSTKRASASSSTVRADNRQHPHPLSPTKTVPLPTPRVVRRVQAVIEVPVKEEEEEGYEQLDAEQPPPPPDAPTAVLHPASTPTATARGGDARRCKSSAGSHRHRSEVAPSDHTEAETPSNDEIDDGDDDGDDDDDEYVNREEGAEVEVENAMMDITFSARRKTVPWGRKQIFHEPDEEDDELMMYSHLKDNPHKPRLAHIPRPPRRKSVTNVTAQRTPTTNASAQKRRTTEIGPGSGARAKRRR